MVYLKNAQTINNLTNKLLLTILTHMVNLWPFRLVIINYHTVHTTSDASSRINNNILFNQHTFLRCLHRTPNCGCWWLCHTFCQQLCAASAYTYSQFQSWHHSLQLHTDHVKSVNPYAASHFSDLQSEGSLYSWTLPPAGPIKKCMEIHWPF